MSIIKAVHLRKRFIVKKKEPGLKGALKGIFAPKKIIINALDDVSFSMKKGEIIGLIGPNGAGKSTTIKILTGILQPLSGEVEVMGLNPQKKRAEVVSRIGVVFGQRSQLYWDIRLGESFELFRRIYRIPDEEYNANLELMDSLLGIRRLIDIPVRQLSLGQRMRGEIVSAVLHSPDILFLDEPTIGLDIQAKRNIRKFIREINQKKKTTIILTTHDLGDVQELCPRLVVINKGKIIEDGALDAIVHRLAPERILQIDTDKVKKDFTYPHCKMIKCEENKMWISFNRENVSASKLIAALSAEVRINDLQVKEPDIEDAIEQIYGEG
ncbi:MAG: ATP-binding cassette domain-containing protein [Spirochaetales bacterium]|nr:ATP-binding cassette domain-containing protein [Spirochaetales bacterium]